MTDTRFWKSTLGVLLGALALIFATGNPSLPNETLKTLVKAATEQGCQGCAGCNVEEGEGEGEGEQEGEVANEGEGEWEGEGEREGEGEGEGETDIIMLPGSVPLVLVRIPAGSFQMGSPDTERSRGGEDPVHTVTINYDFYMGTYEVTQRQWLAVMGSWPGMAPSSTFGAGDDYPAYYVSWNDAKNFIAALNTHITNTGQGPATVRLPSEAEWEYACRANTTTRFYFGDSLSVNDSCEDDAIRSQYMWYCGNNTASGPGYGSKPVGGKLENAFGLHDMSGNLWELCEDDWHVGVRYLGAPSNGSAWIDSPRGSSRMMRGGYWYSDALYCRSARRFDFSASARGFDVGFRLVR
jgi:formylglycine-generating enzyme required for sulfatase activity